MTIREVIKVAIRGTFFGCCASAMTAAASTKALGVPGQHIATIPARHSRTS